jgi:hypothetical protein
VYSTRILTAASLGSFLKGQMIYGKGFASYVRQELSCKLLTNGMRSSTKNVWKSGNRDRRGCESGQERVRGEGKDTRCGRPYLEYSIMRFRGVCAMWVHGHRNSCIKWPVCPYDAEEEDAFKNTVTDDKWRIQHFQPESKCTSTRWHHLGSPVTKSSNCCHQPARLCRLLGLPGRAACPFSKAQWHRTA